MAEDKKQVEEKRYALLPKDSIKAYAEATGISDLPDEVATLLAEDVVYRLREATQHSCQFMRHARRKRLTTEDFNKALRNSDLQPVLGYNNPEPLGFRQTKEGELHMTEDPEINLVEEAGQLHLPQHPGQTTIKAHWLAVEGIQKGGSLSQGVPGKGGNGKVPKVSDDLLAYYEHMTKAILGSDEQLIKFALADLRTNAKISPLLPYLVNFISNGVKTVSHDISQLTKLLHTVRALFSNCSLYLEPRPYLNQLVYSVVYCLLEPLAASINPSNDHWALRDYAARLLAQITRDWSNPVNQLQQQNLKALKDVLYDSSKPFCCHYGAIMGLMAFGNKALEDILLPHLATYWQRLHTFLEDTSSAPIKSDAFKVYGIILHASVRVICSKREQILIDAAQQQGEECEVIQRQLSLRRPSLKRLGSGSKCDSKSSSQTHGNITGKDPTLPSFNTPGLKDGKVGSLLDPPNPHMATCAALANLYKEMYEYFGDSLAMRLPVVTVPEYYVQRREEIVVSLADENTKKTGEELLQAFLETEREPAVNGDDVDMDEQSERSSRSERSHSDEGYLDEQADLTVKATVSHPSQGIKLTILKRPKRDSESDSYGGAIMGRQIKKRRLTSQSGRDTLLHLMFDCVPSVRPARFVFSYAGCVQCSEPRGKKWTLHQDFMYTMPTDTTLVNINSRLKPFGKRNLGHSSTASHIHTANLMNFL